MRELKLPVPVKILADSTNWTGSRLTSFLIPLPSTLLAELRTHRLLHWGDDADFSVNANSDRAIPIATKIASVEKDLYTPLPSLHKPGMSAIEDVGEEQASKMEGAWRRSAEMMISQAKALAAIGASKQYVNRLLMPFSWSLVVVTGDDRAWASFFKLRSADDVEPNFRTIARCAHALYSIAEPDFLQPGEWHIAWREEAKKVAPDSIRDQLLVSASCCARISYANEKDEDLDKHRGRAAGAIAAGHTSIIEHQARCPEDNGVVPFSRNVRGWNLLRALQEDSGELGL